MTGTRARAKSKARPQVVYHKLRELIVRGQLAPGARLVETDVARRLGVSRTPVRGALQRLYQEGYVVESQRLKQSRPTVAPLTRDDARELFYIVAEIEGLAARLAALRPIQARHAVAAKLAAINAEFQQAAAMRVQDQNLIWGLDERFHRCYVEAGAGPRLLALHDAVKPQAERYERLYTTLLARDLQVSVVEHAAIIKGIKNGNSEAAQSAVQTNWRNAAERLGGAIEAMGERGAW